MLVHMSRESQGAKEICLEPNNRSRSTRRDLEPVASSRLSSRSSSAEINLVSAKLSPSALTSPPIRSRTSPISSSSSCVPASFPSSASAYSYSSPAVLLPQGEVLKNKEHHSRLSSSPFHVNTPLVASWDAKQEMTRTTSYEDVLQLPFPAIYPNTRSQLRKRGYAQAFGFPTSGEGNRGISRRALNVTSSTSHFPMATSNNPTSLQKQTNLSIFAEGQMCSTSAMLTRSTPRDSHPSIAHSSSFSPAANSERPFLSFQLPQSRQSSISSASDTSPATSSTSQDTSFVASFPPETLPSSLTSGREPVPKKVQRKSQEHVQRMELAAHSVPAEGSSTGLRYPQSSVKGERTSLDSFVQHPPLSSRLTFRPYFPAPTSRPADLGSSRLYKQWRLNPLRV
ncbi:hypothetical protein BT69DRAFT_972815 [Atractiella rhizophila]|nr:hypothetical protein BT69DRAFT_972815 [Atractiella rhizophila]